MEMESLDLGACPLCGQPILAPPAGAPHGPGLCPAPPKQAPFVPLEPGTSVAPPKARSPEVA